jgi:hypothetical protein
MSEFHQIVRDGGVLGVAAITLLLFWRGSEKLGIVGFGKEYQLRRIAEERLASATERTEKAQGEIKAMIAGMPNAVAEAVREAVHEVVKGLLSELRPQAPAPPPPPPAPPPNGARVSAPGQTHAP